MRIDVIPTVDDIKTEGLFQKTVVIVDILRTSSTIISALANGSDFIIPTKTVGEAKALKNENPDYQLAGDRFYKKIPGFDFGNSPSSFSVTSQLNKTIVLTTTNGTRAIQKAMKGEKLLIGGFLNGEYCMKQALALKRDIALLAVGYQNEFSLEDGLASGFLIDMLKKHYHDSIEINDFGIAMFGMYKYYEGNLKTIIKSTQTAKKLIQLGHGHDVEFSSQMNIYPVCPYINNDQIITVLQ